MKAARLHDGATKLVIEEHPDPKPRPGAAVVRLQSAFMSASLAGVVRGTSHYQTPLRPFTPGMDAVGTVASLGEGVSGLKVGDPVYCDSYIEEARADGTGENAFAGYFALTGGAGPLLAAWPNGTLATHIELPAECLTNVAPALRRTSADTLSRLGWLGTAHAAFTKTGFQPGGTVAVLGATGLLGVSTVLVALAMGAAKVIAVGRSADRLRALQGLDPRVEIATELKGRPQSVDLAIQAASDGAELIEDALPALRRYGALVILASTSRPPALAGLLLRDITVRYSLWFARKAPSQIVQMIASGALDLSRITSETFPLDRVDEAIAACGKPAAPFTQVVVRC